MLSLSLIFTVKQKFTRLAVRNVMPFVPLWM